MSVLGAAALSGLGTPRRLGYAMVIAGLLLGMLVLLGFRHAKRGATA